MLGVKSGSLHLGVLILLPSLLWGAPADAATKYYVDQSNLSASDSNAGTSLALPWATIRRAAQTMVAGDTTFVRGGTYLQTRTGSVPVNDRFYPALQATNSGTASQPIVFKGYGADSVIIKYSPSETGHGPLIGAYERTYIVWDGFIVQETAANYQPDTGPVVMSAANGSAIKNCDIRCVVVNYLDNHNGIRLEQIDNCLVSNNRIRGIGDGGNEHNHAGIMTYAMDHSIIEHNEINNCFTGIFIKGGPLLNDHPIVRYNVVHDCQVSIRMSFTLNAKIYQNIIRDGLLYDSPTSGATTVGIEYAETCTGTTSGTCQPSASDPATTVSNRDVYNNTIYNVYQGIVIGGTPDRITGSGNDWRSNVIVTSHYPLAVGVTTAFGEVLTNDFTSDYNGFYSLTAYRGAGTNYTLPGWVAALQDDQNSSEGDPLFVDPANHDFHLRSGSPEINAGIDWGDLNNNGSTTDRITRGAYITGSEVIGPSTTPPGPQDALAPSAVRDLTPR
jgi:copper-binding protein NosD